MAEFTHTVVISAPLARVVEVALEPHSWPTWWASLGATEHVDGDGAVGTTSRIRLGLAGSTPATVTCRVTENRPDGSSRHHWRVDVDGAVAGWQTLDFETVGAFDEEPAPEGTLVRAEVHLVTEGPAAGADAGADDDAALRQALGGLKTLIEA